MWSNTVQATTAALFWLGLIVLAYFQIYPRTATGFARVAGRIWPMILLTAFVVRLVPMVLLPVGAGYDIESFSLAATALLNGQDVYTSAAINRHPYLPFQMYWLGLAMDLARGTAVPFVVWVKLAGVLADVGITALIYRSARQFGKPRNIAAFFALLYAFSPISILVSAYHGQFDSVALFLLLLAWYYWQFGEQYRASAVALGFAILDKTWPVIFLPLLLWRARSLEKRGQILLISLLIPAVFTIAYLIAYHGDPMALFGRALTHTGGPGYWGPSAILAVLGKYSTIFASLYAFLVSLRYLLLLAAFGAAFWFTRHDTALEATLMVLLSIFAVTVGIGIQWLVWLVPFAILSGELGWLRRYTAAGLIFLLGQLYGLHMINWATIWFNETTADNLIRLSSLPAWAVVVAWLVHRITQPRRKKNRS